MVHSNFEGTTMSITNWNMPETKPHIVTDEHLKYLDDLRESGVTNMYGAGAYLEGTFDLTEHNAHIILAYWMKQKRNEPR